MYLAYSVLLSVVYILALPYFVYQAIRYRKYIGSLDQRLGFLPLAFNVDREESIWIHAVSVGETLTARALIADLKRSHPALRLFLSTTTIAGQQVARETPHLDGVFYFPFDWAFIVRRTLKVVRPRLFIMMETEIWPNLLRACRAGGVKTVLNQRPHLVALVSAVPAGQAALQARARERRSSLCAERGIGAAARRTRSRPEPRLRHRQPQVRFRGGRGRRPPYRPDAAILCSAFSGSRQRVVVVAGSTMRGEEAAVLRAFARVKASAVGALLVVAPRHPERFDEAEQLARSAGFSTLRRSTLPIDAEPRADVVILDTWASSRSSIGSPPRCSSAAV